MSHSVFETKTELFLIDCTVEWYGFQSIPLSIVQIIVLCAQYTCLSLYLSDAN